MKSYSKISVASFILAIIASLMFLLSGYGYQWGWWELGFAFQRLIPGAALAALLGLILLIVYGIRKSKSSKAYKGSWMIYASVILCLAVLGNFGYWYLEIQKGYPPIHDITTDTENPPEFEAIVPLRADAPNKTEYGGEEIAEAQKAFYDGLETMRLEVAPAEAYDKALIAAQQMPWEIVAQSKEDLRIEAFHKLPWFGFIDDVVIRVDTTDNGSKIDVRSVSRVGRGDLGVNADRIKSYLAEIEKE
ncbi:DUF1499 domain-containing protein [Balneolaceae bacterium YR4-1]|uniref:DUF1499 domain-containing protein n=1 Tax=Halalkalibaculum roseum TaxID=2709311 RepID=A0A6M1T2W9_9BACT|nr:DUF1499 domain-containing protein [Halalkalibaculum roseum]NGP76345.1 DUF1499 domain-containing protein [Halalkalibaculum roseum]